MNEYSNGGYCNDPFTCAAYGQYVNKKCSIEVDALQEITLRPYAANENRTKTCDDCIKQFPNINGVSHPNYILNMYNKNDQKCTQSELIAFVVDQSGTEVGFIPARSQE